MLSSQRGSQEGSSSGPSVHWYETAPSVMSDVVDVGLLEFSRNVLDDASRPGEYFYELNALVPDRPRERIYLPLEICRTSVNFYTKDRNGRRSLLPKGVLPHENVGVVSGGGATLRQRQEGSSSAANSNGNGLIRYPSGARHRVVQEGAGRVPTPEDPVKVDLISWFDAFDGREKWADIRGEVYRVSDLYECEREAVLSMREGEVRQIIAPGGYGPYIELRLISIE
ncbi:unnamed protein product [Vitrella brassicaformis CCMP3155]|uniref:Uncharacterized protein n=1 Tax=Vitrella brassicaformis (strain CCMP3155) TaxID=1169540 RepID=A0A0G4H4Q7_VITBC|nr:unnamed protein product [Vitrella brassicaformis CCMP3155]|eukprot:CEM38766.1 unnamed protein product [Vitrella brassicaformis CCMP3155]